MNTTYETGATNHKVNDIVLTVINDGNGSQCGMTHAERYDITIGEWVIFARACRHYAPTASAKDIADAASLVLNFYRDHKKEVQNDI